MPNKVAYLSPHILVRVGYENVVHGRGVQWQHLPFGPTQPGQEPPCLPSRPCADGHMAELLEVGQGCIEAHPKVLIEVHKFLHSQPLGLGKMNPCLLHVHQQLASNQHCFRIIFCSLFGT